MDKIRIAIDGPAGSGKSTIAKIIAKTLGVIYLDTGAMYRTVALKAIKENISTSDKVKLSELMKNIDIDIRYSGEEQHIFLDNEDVSNKIRTPEISIGATDVAVIPEVRLKMVELQRNIAKKNSIVMDGRDIGTYVLPNATLKIFLTASIDERVKRRYKELLEKKTESASFEDVKRDMEYRDKNDSTREFAPLSKAEDAVEIDTTNLSIEEVTEKITLLLGSIRRYRETDDR